MAAIKTVKDFIDAYKGSYVDKYGKTTSSIQLDEPFGGQCASLARLFVNTLGDGYKANTYGHGKDYIKIQNGKKVKIPRDGDLVVWPDGAGGYGHVGIMWNGKVFNQNPVKAKLETIKEIETRNGLSGKIYIRIPLKKGAIMTAPKVGKYKTTSISNIRMGPSSNYKQKTVKQMTAAGKKFATSSKADALAKYKKGTTFSALEIKRNKYGNYWAKTPSGWLLLANDKKVFGKRTSS